MMRNRFHSASPVYLIEHFSETDRYFLPGHAPTYLIARFYRASSAYETLGLLHTQYHDFHGSDRFFRDAEDKADNLTDEGHFDVHYDVFWSDTGDAVLDRFFESAESRDFEL